MNIQNHSGEIYLLCQDQCLSASAKISSTEKYTRKEDLFGRVVSNLSKLGWSQL
jgi:hypothetical protein